MNRQNLLDPDRLLVSTILLGSSLLLGIGAYYKTKHRLVDIQKLLNQRSTIFIIPPRDILLSACLRATELGVLQL
jgi:hypothetical protein